MVGDHQHKSILRDTLEKTSHQLVQFDMVIEDPVFVWIARFVQEVAFVEIAPEAVIEPVDTHFDHHEEVPVLLEHPRGEPESGARHLMNLLEQPRFVVCPKAFDVDNILAAGPAVDLGPKSTRIGEVRILLRRKEATDRKPVNRPRGICLGNSEEHAS